MKKFVATLVLSLGIGLPMLAQRAARPAGTLMVYEIVEGDTVYYDVLSASRIISARGRKSDIKKYYRLIYNFNKVYPYALTGRKMIAQVDSTIAADVTGRGQRAAYINRVEKELLSLFEKDIRRMTVSQGVLLLRLIDRECGKTGYEIIRDYESKLAAGFWQLVAKLFSHDLKLRYDPDGIDAATEELVWIWDSGQWNGFYRSVFGEDPPVTTIASDRLNSSAKTKK